MFIGGRLAIHMTCDSCDPSLLILLQEDEWDWLESLPLKLQLDLPQSPLPVMVVHAGLVPGVETAVLFRVWAKTFGRLWSGAITHHAIPF